MSTKRMFLQFLGLERRTGRGSVRKSGDGLRGAPRAPRSTAPTCAECAASRNGNLIEMLDEVNGERQEVTSDLRHLRAKINRAERRRR